MADVTPGELPTEVSWVELMAAMSLACDTAMGLPLESGLRTCLVAVELGSRLDLDEDQVRRVHRLALVQHIGCTSVSSELAGIVGDEILMRSHAATLDFTDQKAMFRFMLGHIARANPVLARPIALARAMAGGKRILASVSNVCEAGQLLCSRYGSAAADLADLDAVYENWDGSGLPNGLAGDVIPVATRVVQVAALAVNAEHAFGADAAGALVRARRARSFAPDVVDAFVADPTGILAVRREESLWEAVLDADPAPDAVPGDSGIDDALTALADFTDLKSPYLVGHSRGVAALAEAAAREYGLGTGDVTLARRAGLVHDVGRIAVSSAIWDSRAPLTPDQREQVQMHPHHTRQVLSRTPFLRTLSETASAHHERLDGSGYHRGLPASAQGVVARILAVADCYRGKTEPRPHREALTTAEAATFVHAEAAAGRLDGAAVEAVLAATGTPRTGSHPKLTPREIEILVAVAGGGSMREVARALSIAPKTVDGHLQRIYPKIGVSTRAGAALFTLEHGLLPR